MIRAWICLGDRPIRLPVLFLAFCLFPTGAWADRLPNTTSSALDALNGALGEAAMAAANRAAAAQLEDQAKGQDAVCAS
jgi:hypothetical protein